MIPVGTNEDDRVSAKHEEHTPASRSYCFCFDDERHSKLKIENVVGVVIDEDNMLDAMTQDRRHTIVNLNKCQYYGYEKQEDTSNDDSSSCWTRFAGEDYCTCLKCGFKICVSKFQYVVALGRCLDDICPNCKRIMTNGGDLVV